VNKRFSLLLLLAAALIAAFATTGSAAQTQDEFLASFQKALESRDGTAYAACFATPIREWEKSAFLFNIESEAIDSIRSRKAGEKPGDDGVRQVALQVLFQNSYSAVLEIWQLDIAQIEGRWLVIRKTVSGSIRNLYKIGLPLELAERAARVEIVHADIRMTFEDAAVFYDNIPGLDTALLVVGKGRIDFDPSDPEEKHQLQLLYKSQTLKDEVESVFVRCSNAFFQSNIKIRPAEGKAIRPVSPAEKAAASLIFREAYPRSFAIQNSMTGELLSFLPQGDEAVFEFRSPRLGEMTYVYSPFSEEEVSLFDRESNRVINLYSPMLEDESKNRKFFVSLEDRFDVTNYDIELEFRPAQMYISARARISVVPLSGSQDVLKLRLSPDLEILRVFDAEKRELFYTTDKLRKNIYIYFSERPALNEPTTIEIIYRGKLLPVPPTMDVVGQYGPGDIRYVHVPQPETIFYSHSSFWCPQPAEDDFFNSRLKIVVPPEFGCVSNGELVERGRLKDMDEVVEIEKMGSSFFTFQTRAPVKYLAFIIGKFEKLEEFSNSPPIQLLAASDVSDQRKSYLAETKDILKAYEEWFGPFLFEKLTIVQRLWPDVGGHSPASFIILNESPRKGGRIMFKGPESPVDLSRWREYFLAHEIAHQWWGQGVTWATYRDLWLSEGMAQFAAVYYLGRHYGDETFASILKRLCQWTRKKSDIGSIRLGSRLSFLDYNAFQSVVYDKAALVLNMLRDLVGDETFFRGLRDFIAAHRFGAVRTAQFRAAMEKASGLDLGRFFKGWFDSYQLPEVKVSWTESRTDAGSVLAVKVRQTKEPWVFPLWIQWESGGRVFREKMIVDAPVRDYSFKTAGRVSKVRVNPDSAFPGLLD
jgi:hypothetical protein